jgi:hypothetical protein
LCAASIRIVWSLSSIFPETSAPSQLKESSFFCPKDVGRD